MDTSKITAKELTDSVGAAGTLSRRFGRSFSINSLHQLVKHNKLRSFIFIDGNLIERTEENHSKGKDLIFFIPDLWSLEEPKVGRPNRRKKKTSPADISLDKIFSRDV